MLSALRLARCFVLFAFLVVLFAPPVGAQPPPKFPDPTGANAGVVITPAPDGKGDASPATLKSADLYERIAHNAYSINMVWVLICGFLVMFMQAGFTLVETGLCRAKNAANISTMNFLIYPLACFAFWAYGFGIGWGNWYNGPVPPGWVSTLGPGTEILNEGVGLGPVFDENNKPTGAFKYGVMGTKGFFLNPEDVSVLSLFFFMMVFLDTTATVPTGALAERWAWDPGADLRRVVRQRQVRGGVERRRSTGIR